MNENYRELTSHSHNPGRTPTVPRVGQRIDISPIMIFQDEDPETHKLGTPMSKLRYFEDKGEWRQVGRNEAGMFFFFLNEPEASHTACIVRSIIPSQTACYADLIV